MKKERQNKLLELIEKNAIETQDELQKALVSSGFDVTQATVSRDIKELRIVKVLDANGIYRYAASNKNTSSGRNFQYRDIFAHSVISVDFAINNVVIKCHSGMAQGACASLDMMECSNVLGTLAGDDTILVIVRSEGDAAELTKMIKELIK